ncbi:IclR family transcriptional regulator [Iamia majanohamensis]|uniref:IclR family transcriptional regulator n=1 Tax=Iamia majanohamensis TaxID=467976 RepID=A0AAE9Y485_9ACTN|nr:IclR family transcriptional regulator [Iamia majanohamensis]WCO66350.1 IclR family transcriptional regulator [Iamia majanohamensis]
MEQSVRTVGVLDKSVAVLRALADGPLALADLVGATGLSRATAHRLASALVDHGLVRRTDDGRFALGAELVGLGRAAAAGWPWGEAAGPALAALVEATGESAQLYVREGDARRCLLSRDSAHELRSVVVEGARLPLEVGSAGRVLRDPAAAGGDGWVASVEERAPGVASVSAPVRAADGTVVAAVGISGPVDRLGPTPGPRHGPAVVAAATRIASALPR